MIEVTIPYPPSVNRIWRQGKGSVYRSKEYTDWLALAAWEIRSQLGPKSVISKPFKLTLLVKRPDKRKRDLDNLLKPILDLLEHYGLIENDHLCHWIDARWTEDNFECRIMLELIDHGEKK